MSGPLPFFALTTRGLESVSAREAAALPGVTVIETGYRRVAGRCERPDALLGLRTVDDVFAALAVWPEIGRARSTLARLHALAAALDPRPVLAACASLRPLPRVPAFSVSASFVGARNYRTAEIKAAVADGFSQASGWRAVETDAAADLNLRLFIEHETAYAGLRLAARPLQDRPYRHVELPGALKPPVAAAMLNLAGLAPGMRLLDPCCGSGTILIEAALGGAFARGGDLNPTAIQAAQTNAAAARVSPALTLLDAGTLPYADCSIDALVVNLPWGRQVAATEALAAFYARALAEMARVLAPGGRLVLLTALPQLVQVPGRRRVDLFEISLSGQTPSVMIFSA